MELLRQIPGLEEKILAADVIDFVNEAHITIATDMKDPNPEVLLAGNDDTMSRLIRLTPAGFGALPQSKIEAILRRTAEELGGDLRFSTRLESFDEDDDGVVATLVDLPTGRRYRVAADYLVAADGWQAPVREWLELPTHGVGELWRCRTILFDADLTELLAGRKALLTYFKNDEFTGLAAYLENAREVFGVSGAHLLGINYFIERGESDDDFTDERCVELVRKAMVEPDLEVTITDQSTFVIAHRVADRMREGRVFLAGDSAHVMPQTGGLGGATAIQDGYDIAWRIAAVVAGYAGPNLLTGYDAERRPVGSRPPTGSCTASRTDGATAQDVAVRRGGEPGLGAPGLPGPLAVRQHRTRRRRRPAGGSELAQARPGSRAPHVPVRHGDREISLLDLFGRDHVLLLGSPGTPWRAAAEKQAAALGVPLPVYAFGADLTDHTGEAARRYDLGPTPPSWSGRTATWGGGPCPGPTTRNGRCATPSPPSSAALPSRSSRRSGPSRRCGVPRSGSSPTSAADVSRIAVVGAGMAGLAAALFCARRGHEVTLLSATPPRRRTARARTGGSPTGTGRACRRDGTRTGSWPGRAGCWPRRRRTSWTTSSRPARCGCRSAACTPGRRRPTVRARRPAADAQAVLRRAVGREPTVRLRPGATARALVTGRPDGGVPTVDGVGSTPARWCPPTSSWTPPDGTPGCSTRSTCAARPRWCIRAGSST
ncbi:FAD-dependent oxidoreductase [Micromonospora sp. BRA006-A]|nr:FAD-dependent oxidoreductase [Micromonospora sp. BRA006-A]